MRAICRQAFDLGITHFDLANNYGPPPGSAETAFGDILRGDFAGYRDELVISTKAGYRMWPGPYGEWGSRKYLLASLDQSLKRMGLDYVDIFYSHRFDPETPLEETMGALDHAVRQGKALYVGISSYNSQRTARGGRDPARARHAVPHPPAELFDDQPLDRGRSSARHARSRGRRLHRLLAARAGHAHRQISRGHPAGQPRRGRQVASTGLPHDGEHRTRACSSTPSPQRRGQTLAQMALAWMLRDKRVTSALIGASSPEQVDDCVEALRQPRFTPRNLRRSTAMRSKEASIYGASRPNSPPDAAAMIAGHLAVCKDSVERF